jgi:hypothetical protein
MSADNPQPTDRRRRLAPPHERAKARAVAHFVEALDDPNPLVVLTLVCAAFPDIKLSTALVGTVFHRLLAKPAERMLQ